MKISMGKPLAQQKDEALVALDRIAASKRYAKTGGNSDIHAIKKAEAIGILEAGLEDTPFLKAESEYRGISVEEMAEIIMSKSDDTDDYSVRLEARRQWLQDVIRSAKSAPEIRDALSKI